MAARRLSDERPRLLLGAFGAAAGGALGALVGWAVGAPVFGALVGALGTAGSAILAESTACNYFDRAAAERFGQGFGALGGGLTALGGWIIAITMMATAAMPASPRD